VSEAAIELSVAGNLLVIAPPGCGKTELLARRAEAIIPLLMPHQRILALTFSNKAKANLNSRLVAVLGTERKRRYVSVHNFHGHAAEIVRSHGRTAGIDPLGEMPDKHTQANAVEPFLEGLEGDAYYAMKDRVEGELREAKRGSWNDNEVLDRLCAGDSRSLAVETARQANGTYFYDDLLRHSQRLLRMPEIAHLYQSHYAAVLVDEFQDLSPQQLEIALRSSSKSRTFVGDPMQGIYSWTGAKPAHVERVLRLIAGEAHGLGVSYRSSPAVLQVLAAVARPLGGHLLDPHDPDGWFEGGIAAGGTYSTAEAEASFVLHASSEILARHPNDTIGVICRNGWRRKQIDAAFAESGLPCIRWDLAVDEARIVEMLHDAAARLGGNPDLQTLGAEARRVLDPSDIDTASELASAVVQIAELVEQSGSVGAALAQLRVSNDVSDVISPGVHLLNAHTGKGQQFDWVFIPGFENGNIPSYKAKKPDDIEEEQRVLLVMLSRARHGVVLTRASKLVAKAGHSYSPSESRWAAIVRDALGANSSEFLAHVSRIPVEVEVDQSEVSPPA
jgi:DNA helicase-2/ATP-dependent DNA helicase PcrA